MLFTLALGGYYRGFIAVPQDEDPETGLLEKVLGEGKNVIGSGQIPGAIPLSSTHESTEYLVEEPKTHNITLLDMLHCTIGPLCEFFGIDEKLPVVANLKSKGLTVATVSAFIDHLSNHFEA